MKYKIIKNNNINFDKKTWEVEIPKFTDYSPSNN